MIARGTVAPRPAPAETGALLERIESVVYETLGSEAAALASRAPASLPPTARDATGARAGASDVLAALESVADVVASVALERPWTSDALRRVVAATAAELALPYQAVASSVCGRALRDPRLLAVPPRLAIEAQLGLLFVAPGVRRATVSARHSDGRLEKVVELQGDETVPGDSSALRVLGGAAGRSAREGATERADSHEIPVGLRGQPSGLLELSVAAGCDDGLILRLASEAAAAVAPALDKLALLERNESRERRVAASLERRLARLAFDLHDGALQSIAALTADVRLLRAQLAGTLPADEPRAILVGRLDDVDARLVALEQEVRGLACSVDAPSFARRPLADVLRDEVTAFRAATGIVASFRAEGDFEHLTASQRIALVRMVQEAFANGREHSGASAVTVSVVRARGYVRAEVVDDGCGFDVERALVQAARNGRLGLVGMGERVRLLGGSFTVESGPGRPTTISAMLPEWSAPTEHGEEVESLATGT